MSSYVELHELKKEYPTPLGSYVVVEQFNLRMHKGEIVALIGHSGCGKSTIMSMVAGLNPVTSGVIIVANKEVEGPGPDRAVVFQAPSLLPWLSAYDNVKLGLDQVFRQAPRQQREAGARSALALVGLADAADKHPTELSSGMQQRVGIARALALKPKMLLLDEPFGMLDSLTRMELQEVLLRLIEGDRTTAMIVTHDVDEALFLADRVVMMTSGPRAHVGAVLQVPFPRPRTRAEVVEHPRYYKLREELIAFLASQEPQGTQRLASEAAA